jgi:chromosome segregation ATPase
MDDIEQKIKETKRELAELKQRKRDSAGQRINDRLAEYGDRLAECNDMLNTLLETSKKLDEAIKSLFGAGLGKVPLKLDKVSPELRNELMRKGQAFSSLVQEVKTQTLFVVEPNEWKRTDTAHSIGFFKK